MRSHVLTAVVAAFTAVVAMVLASPDTDGSTGRMAGPVSITEDSPAWDCRTMGNRICGPLSDETTVAVGVTR